MQALFIGQTYIDVTFITDHMPTGDEKHVASDYAVSFSIPVNTPGVKIINRSFAPAELNVWISRAYAFAIGSYE